MCGCCFVLDSTILLVGVFVCGLLWGWFVCGLCYCSWACCLLVEYLIVCEWLRFAAYCLKYLFWENRVVWGLLLFVRGACLWLLLGCVLMCGLCLFIVGVLCVVCRLFVPLFVCDLC